MRILHVGPGILPIPPPAYGAIERHIANLAQQQEVQGHQVEVVNKPLGSEYRWLPSARRRVQQRDWDVVHLHSDFIAGALAGYHPSVYTVHNPNFVTGPPNIRARWGLMWARRAARRASAVIVHTAVIRDALGEARPPETLDTIPNGVDTDLYAPRAATRTGRRVAIFGAVIPRKNVHIVAEATRGLDVDLHCVGIRPDPRYAARVASFGQHVQFHDGLDDARLVDLLGGMDLLVHPTSADTFSMAVLEAMSCGVPILGSPIVRFQLDGNGAIVDDPSPAAWRHAIRAALDTPSQLKAWGERSRTLAVERYDWSVIAGEVEGVYRRVVARARALGARA